MQNHRTRRGIIRRFKLLPVALLPVFAATVICQCGQLAVMKSYSVCIASGLRAERNESLDRVVICDHAKRCPTFFGAAPAGLAFLIVRPAGPEMHYNSARELVEATVPHAGKPAPEVQEVDLGTSNSGLSRKCFRTRRLLEWAGAWDEYYGLYVDGRFFCAWTRYEDDPKKVDQYRAEIRDVLSSLRPR